MAVSRCCCTVCVVDVELYSEQQDALNGYKVRYSLPSVDKALRVLLEYASTDGDATMIFGKVRSAGCGK